MDSDETSKPKLRELWPALGLLLASLVGTLLVGVQPAPGQTRFAVITPPWYRLADAASLVGTAGGETVDVGGLPNIIIAHSDDPAFAHTLYRNGAWLVMDENVARGCLAFAAATRASPEKGES